MLISLCLLLKLCEHVRQMGRGRLARYRGRAGCYLKGLAEYLLRGGKGQ